MYMCKYISFMILVFLTSITIVSIIMNNFTFLI